MLIIFREMGYVFGKAKFWTPKRGEPSNEPGPFYVLRLYWICVNIYIYILNYSINHFSRCLPHQWSLSQFAHASHVITKNYQIERVFVCVMCFGWFSSCLMFFRHVGRQASHVHMVTCNKIPVLRCIHYMYVYEYVCMYVYIHTYIYIYDNALRQTATHPPSNFVCSWWVITVCVSFLASLVRLLTHLCQQAYPACQCAHLCPDPTQAGVGGWDKKIP